MDWKNYIISDKEILVGKPIIKGTRISVEFVLKLLAAGWSENQIFENYPQLKKEHFQAIFALLLENIEDKFMLNSNNEVA